MVLPRSLFLVLVLVLVTIVAAVGTGCGSPREDPTSSEHGSAIVRAPATTPPAASPSAPGARPLRPRARIDAPARTALQAAVAEGRALERTGDHAGALVAFERALALDARSPRLRCEAGFVAFRANDLPRADRYVTQAMLGFPPAERIPVELRVPVAMCLYNVGLVQSALHDDTLARRSFERSLALRENATVRARLSQLGAQPVAADPVGADRRVVAAREFCEVVGYDGGPCGLAGTVPESDAAVSVSVEAHVPTGTAPAGVEAHVLVATGVVNMTEEKRTSLFLRRGPQTIAAEIDFEENPGMFGITAESSLTRVAWADVVPGGAPELVIALQGNRNDEDMGICQRNGSTYADLFICGELASTYACVRIPLTRMDYFEDDGDCEDSDSEGPAHEYRGYVLEHEFRGPMLRLTRGSESPEAAPATIPARRNVDAWLADPAFAFPARN